MLALALVPRSLQPCLVPLAVALIGGCAGLESEFGSFDGPLDPDAGTPPAAFPTLDAGPSVPGGDSGAAPSPPIDAGASPPIGEPPSTQDGGVPLDDAGAPDAGDAGASDSGPGTDAGSEPFWSLERLLVTELVAPGQAGFDQLALMPSLDVVAVPSPCGPPISAGHVVSFTPDSDGTLELRVDSEQPHTALLQSNCGVLNSTKDCRPETSSTSLRVPVIAGERACLAFGFANTVTAQVKLTAPVCGDGVLNPATEECDFGDQAPSDGCDKDCQLETPEEGDFCPGKATTLEDRLSLDDHTIGYADRAPPTCGALPGAGDRHYTVIPAKDGVVTASLAASFDGVLSVFTGCSESQRLLSDVLACSDAPLSDAEERVTFAVKRLELYHVIVDGYAPRDFGTFRLDLELSGER